MNIKPLTSTRAWKSEPRQSSFAFFLACEQCCKEEKKLVSILVIPALKCCTKKINITTTWIRNAWEKNLRSTPRLTDPLLCVKTSLHTLLESVFASFINQTWFKIKCYRYFTTHICLSRTLNFTSCMFATLKTFNIYTFIVVLSNQHPHAALRKISNARL